MWHKHTHTSLPGSVRLNRREAHFSRILGGSDILLLSASSIWDNKSLVCSAVSSAYFNPEELWFQPQTLAKMKYRTYSALKDILLYESLKLLKQLRCSDGEKYIRFITIKNQSIEIATSLLSLICNCLSMLL